jgi:hypothetical protein
VETYGRIGKASMRTLNALATLMHPAQSAKGKRGDFISSVVEAVSMAMFRNIGLNMHIFRTCLRTNGKVVATSKDPQAWLAAVIHAPVDV